MTHTPTIRCDQGVTTWIEHPEGGRDRGPRGILRAWIEVLIRPTRFFRNGVSPGDQAPGLTFAIAIAAVFTGGWMLTDPQAIPSITGSPGVSAAITLIVVAVLAAPVGLHITAATAVIAAIVASFTRHSETTGAIGFHERAGVSETVQVVAYAAAPFALAGPPIPVLRVGCAMYATCLLVIGVRTIHETTWLRALVGAVPPALVGYWVGFRASAALRVILG